MLQLQDSCTTSMTIEKLMCHKPIELDISTNIDIEKETIQAINENSENLRALHLGDSLYKLYRNVWGVFNTGRMFLNDLDEDYTLKCPHLQVLSMQGVNFSHMWTDILSHFPRLTYLELADCVIDKEIVNGIKELTCLQTLNLHGTHLYNLKECFDAISHLVELR